MSRNGSGTYSLASGNPVVTGTTISSTWANNTLTDIATALTNSIATNGETPVVANLIMSGFKHTGVAAGTAYNDYADVKSVQNQTYNWCGTAGGTANAITIAPSPASTALAIGQEYVFKAGAASNSGATTLTINSLPAIALQHNGAACVGTEVVANQWHRARLTSLTAAEIERLNIGPRYKLVTFTRDVSLASGTQAVTGVGGTPIAVIFIATITTTATFSVGFDDGTTKYSIRANDGITTDTWAATSTASIDLQIGGAGTDYVGAISSLDADGFTITWTKQGSPTGTATIYALVFK